MYYKQVSDGYIIAVGVGKGEQTISHEEYETILGIVRNKPTAEDGFEYKLKKNLEWELYELPPVPEYDELTAEDYEEALGRFGV